jgi:hypothetical protein
VFRPLGLASVAARAEAIRLRQQAKRLAAKIVYGMTALLFLPAALFWLHVAFWYWLRGTLSHEEAALMIGGGDILLGAILGGLAARSAPSRTEHEARQVRDTALREATRIPRMAGAVGPWLPVLAPVFLRRFKR